MVSDPNNPHASGPPCQCPRCSESVGPTYTFEFLMECLVRWYVRQPVAVQAAFVATRVKKYGPEIGLAGMREAASRLGLAIRFPGMRDDA